MESACPQGEDHGSPRRPCHEPSAPEGELRRPYWKYLERQNREDYFERSRALRDTDAAKPSTYEPIRSADLRSARIGEVSPVQAPPAARLEAVYRISRPASTGRLIDFVA